MREEKREAAGPREKRSGRWGRERESVHRNACEMDGTPKKSEAVLIYGCPWVELGRNVPALPSRYTGGSGDAEFLAS